MPTISRRQLLRMAGLLGASAILTGVGCSGPDSAPRGASSEPSALPTSASQQVADGKAYMAVARNGDPPTLTQRAIAAIGGMERFVKQGANVIIKPNMCVAYHTYEYAATTNPEVVGELVRLCLAAGAKRVRVMDMPFGGRPEEAYKITGVQDAVEAAGGEMEIMTPVKYNEVAIPEGKDLAKVTVYQDILDADLVINVPIPKHHNLARLTLSGKNLLGITYRPNQFHSNLGQRIADLSSLVRPQLTVIDAVRILMNHGPTGGNLADVKTLNTVIASHDMVAADAYAATFFGLEGQYIDYVKSSADMGLGTLDLKNIKIEEINV